jgi:GTP-binding protein Era
VRSGFVTVVGRPNVGKSSLLNAMVGTKVSIVSDKPQTTRRQVRGILTRNDGQLVFVDTPGLHKAETALGERCNQSALDAASGVDAVVLVVDATQPVGTGDRWVAARFTGAPLVVVVNKCDAASRDRILAQLAAISDVPASAFFPVSATTGEGVEALVEHLIGMVPEGELLYPAEQSADASFEQWIAELVRERLLTVTRDEVPYSVATRATSSEDGSVRCEIVVERESQKGIVIGRGGSVLKGIRNHVRRQVGHAIALELAVTVDPGWQHRADRVERLGY